MFRENIHKGLRVVCIIALLGLFWSCKSSKIDKTEAKAQDMAALQTLLEQDNYYVNIEVAYPFVTAATQRVANALLLRNTGNNANRIDVRGDGNFIKIQNDSISGYLPFFGERRNNSGAYGGRNSAIQFKEALEDLGKQINSEKGKLELKFTVDQTEGTEHYQILMDIFPNKKVSVNITPTYKTNMRYSGKLTEADKSI